MESKEMLDDNSKKDDDTDISLSCAEKAIMSFLMLIALGGAAFYSTQPHTMRGKAEQACQEMRELGGEPHMIARISGKYLWESNSEVFYYCQPEPADESAGETELSF